MKYMLTLILVLASLISGASAVGNYMSQSNGVSATGSGPGSISSTQTNVGVIVGDFNALTQTNGADLYSSAVDGVIGLSQSNAELIVGDWNRVSQDNLARVDLNGGSVNAITETQSNIGLIVGDGNRASQSNDAWDVINGGSGNTITDTQSNVGLQIGNFNNLEQTNDKLNWQTTERTDTYTWFGYPYWSYSWITDATPVAGATINGGSGNTITQTQSNVGLQVGTGNSMSQYNDAMAQIDSSVDSEIVQDQSNIGSQMGSWNNLKQTNLLKNYATYTTTNAWGYLYYPWSYSTEVTTDTPTPGALISGGDNSKIDQSQSNAGAQIGSMNNMDQLNDAKAEITWYDYDSVITADQANTGLQIGAWNTMSQTNMKKDWRYEAASGISLYPPDYPYYWQSSGWSQTTPIAGDSISGGRENKITNTQSNIGAQIGTGNSMDQYNYAHAEDNNQAWYSTITQTETNIGLQIGAWNSLDQDNLVRAVDGGDNNNVAQTATNLAAIIGVGDRGTQINDQSATPDTQWYAGDDLITQDASNILLMIGGFDSATQSNDQDAVQAYGTSTPIDQDATNINVVLS